MKSGRVIFFMAAAALSVCVMTALTVRCQEDMVFVNDSAFDGKIRPAVSFNHDVHNENAAIGECNVCHHVVEDGKVLPDESSEDSECSECHAGQGMGARMALAEVFHKRCRECHLDAKAGPVTCAECHAGEK